ncbi:glycosyltransferase [Sphingobium sp. HWE2-09]|uniref:glycosyltransferase n=1 Tax=Sphingobium sp. HWE2-09 TaxID=3108390 RepID=UPI002DC746BA|nr:glycosyltransferase [Sphingobium sp. HWE2-09]
MKISGFVISYNREKLIETCLRSIRFVDELIVVDKSSTDATAASALRLADHVITVPWSPTVEETRAFALEQCSHDRIVFLDDDECFSADAIVYLDRELREGKADLYAIACRHHILGRHEEDAYYWPERHVRAFRRGTFRFGATVHGGGRIEGRALVAEPAFDSGICFHNISHADTATWIEKTNRYTAHPDRSSTMERHPDDLLATARAQIDFWLGKCSPDATLYSQSVAILRAVYDLVDIVKHWEQKEGYDGQALFQATCRQLQDDFDQLERRTGIATGLAKRSLFDGR